MKFQEISVHLLFKFELDVVTFGLRRGVDDREVVSVIALVLNSPANLLDAKYVNGNKQQKKSRFSGCALRPALDAFLRDIGSKIAGIPQCRALGTTLEDTSPEYQQVA